jgi:hypothetical protein
VRAQDLAGDVPVDVTRQVLVDGPLLTLPGPLVDEIGRAAQSPVDASRPGLVLRIERR